MSGLTRAAEPIRVLFAAGQTAGHVNPAIAVAARLRQRDPRTEVFFAATADGFERELIARAGYVPQIVRAAPLRGGSPLRWLRGCAVLPAAFADARALVRKLSPDIVIGVGGYLSAAVVLAASTRRIATLIIEPNVLPGLANRCLSPFADAVAVAWPETAAALGREAAVTGNPVRAELLGLAGPSDDGPLHLLVLGGSDGSRAVNRAMAGALEDLRRLGRPITVAHQTGRVDLDFVRRVYDRSSLAAYVEPFFDDIGCEYARAHLVVAAAGATTCAELAAVGRASVLVPLANAGHHQRENARAIAQAGAALVIDERVLTPAALAAQVTMFVADRARRQAMAKAAIAAARPAAADEVTDLALRLLGRAQAPVVCRDVAAHTPREVGSAGLAAAGAALARPRGPEPSG